MRLIAANAPRRTKLEAASPSADAAHIVKCCSIQSASGPRVRPPFRLRNSASTKVSNDPRDSNGRHDILPSRPGIYAAALREGSAIVAKRLIETAPIFDRHAAVRAHPDPFAVMSWEGTVPMSAGSQCIGGVDALLVYLVCFDLNRRRLVLRSCSRALHECRVSSARNAQP